MKIIWTFTLLMIPGVLSSISVTGYSGGGVSISCRYDRGYTDNNKYFCRGQKPVTSLTRWCSDLIKTEEKNKWVDSGRFSLYDDTSAAVFTVTIRDLREQDSGTYQCAVDHLGIDSYTEVKLNVVTGDSPLVSSVSPITGSLLIISVSVLLLLIFTVILIVTVTLWRRRQSHNADSSSRSSHVTTGNSKTVSHTGCDYEENKHTHKQLPINPSVSPDCVYATVQKDTGDSQIFITSAVDLNYSVVDFQKNPNCPDSVRLRNNQDYSEYAAVNHLTD